MGTPFDSQRSAEPTWSRRDFLGAAALTAGASLLHAPLAGGATRSPVSGASSTSLRRSRIVEVRSRYVIAGRDVHQRLLAEMLEGMLLALTRQPTTERAWSSILNPDDVVGLQFSAAGERLLGTASPLAHALIQSITYAGWSPSQVVCVGTEENIGTRFGTTLPLAGYDREETDFGSGRDQLARALNQVTAIVNVPTLSHHNVAGMSCSLMNLSHGWIKHPARFMSNGCSPYAADIASLPTIRNKLRLNIVNSLRVIFDGGPEGRQDSVCDLGMLFASTDPVACDAHGVRVLNGLRRDRGLSPITEGEGEVRYLRDAQRRGIGVLLAQDIEVERVRL